MGGARKLRKVPAPPPHERKPITFVLSSEDDARKLMDDFTAYLEVDRHAAKKTVYGRTLYLKDYFKYALANKVDLYSKQSIRSFLANYSKPEQSIYGYIARLKPIRLWYSSIGRKDLIESFKLPKTPPSFPIIPTKAELQTFYAALPSRRDKAIFLMLASSGLRLNEVLGLAKANVDFTSRRIIPKGAHATDGTKRSLYSFYNEECEKDLREYLQSRSDDNAHLFNGYQANDYNDPQVGHVNASTIQSIFRRTGEKVELKIMPQSLREWFAEEMSEKGMAERYIDFLCGRTPKSVLSRHYSDYRPEKMKPRYEKADIKVLGDDDMREK